MEGTSVTRRWLPIHGSIQFATIQLCSDQVSECLGSRSARYAGEEAVSVSRLESPVDSYDGAAAK